MNEADRYLPGDPSAKTIREVRRFLRSYGIQPQPKLWRLTWQWAAAVRASYYGVRPRWPIPTDIMTQYLALMLADVKDTYGLKLPHRAADHCPPAVQAALGGGPVALPPVADLPKLPPRTVEAIDDQADPGRLF